MQNLIKTLKDIAERDLDVVNSRGSLAIQQTQRNNLKTEVLNALHQDLIEHLEKEGFGVFITPYGPVIELLNSKVEEQVLKMDDDDLCSGFISIQLDAVMKNLDTNPEIDQESYLHDLEQKRLRAEERERAKRAKTQRDAEKRAEKARQREEAIARLQLNREE